MNTMISPSFTFDPAESQREVYGKMLVEMGKNSDRIVVLDADVSKSTRTVYFADSFPHRFFNMGIAEQNMMATAAGMAKCGLIPFVNTFSFLATFRAADQLRSSVAYPSTNVKVVGHYGGLSDSFDGPTHQSIADIAAVRAIPGMCVIVPADTVELASALPVIAAYNGPVWLRLSRNPSAVVTDSEVQFSIGKANILRKGSDVTLISCGTMAGRILLAADRLSSAGISARVISAATLKPFDEETILAAARETKAIVTCEEHSIIGGLGAAVCETVASRCPVPVIRTGIPDCYCDTGNYDYLLDHFGLSVDAIVKAAYQAMEIKKA